MSTWKPKFIQLPIDKMAGAPWNLLDARGFRIAWCGTDGNHEKDGELIANDLLILIAIGEAVGELHEKALESRAALEAQNEALKKRVEWQPIETAPKDGTVILVCELEDDFVTIGKFNEGHWNGVDHGVHINSGLRIAPTHWMPLPDKPAEQEVD